MSSWKKDAELKWRELSPVGVEIEHDLGALSAGAAQALIELFDRHGLVLARRQTLSMDQQVELMKRIGPILPGPEGKSYISTDAAYGLARAELAFHSDYAFTEHPVHALSLHAVDVVDDASSTRFANAERAYTRFPEALRRRLQAHAVEMIFPGVDTVVSRACDMDAMDVLIRTERPTMLVNPRTGRACAGVSEMHSVMLVGLEREQSRGVLVEAFDHLYAEDNVLEHVWRRGDLVMWDNITLQHARGSLEDVGRRVLQRVAVGEKSLSQMYPQLFSTLGRA